MIHQNLCSVQQFDSRVADLLWHSSMGEGTALQSHPPIEGTVQNFRVQLALSYIKGWTNLNLDSVLHTLEQGERFRYTCYTYTAYKKGVDYQTLEAQLILDMDDFKKYTKRVMSLFRSHQASRTLGSAYSSWWEYYGRLSSKGSLVRRTKWSLK